MEDVSMLVLTRKPGESIMIGNDIRITVVQLGNGRVKVGIDAPPSVTVDRAEVHTRKTAEVDAAVRAELADGNGFHNRIQDRLPAGGPVDPRKSR
jgi:carbon storage regulator